MHLSTHPRPEPTLPRPAASATVRWLPWTTETLAEARRASRPIFLSISSSTCGLRAAMDRDCFQQADVVRLLADHFVPVRVDSEERPDLASLYGESVHLMTGRSGWPLTVVLTPDLEPFFGGTCFHAQDGAEGPGLVTLLGRLAGLWKESRSGVTAKAGQVAAQLRQQVETLGRDEAATHLYGQTLAGAVKTLLAHFDAEHGGFGSAPKHPAPQALGFLLRFAQRTGDRESAAMVHTTLERLAAGGIRDHLGGGFHHCASDDGWQAPHFEKLLYDQAGLALACTDAYLHSGVELHALLVRDICDYVLESLVAPDGAFIAAEGTGDKEQEERFYTWTAAEIGAVLGPACGSAFGQAFGVEATGTGRGPVVLHRCQPSAPLADDLEQARRRLRAVRDRRPRPPRDERVIAAWNGYMIEALAHAGRALDEPRYVEAAERAAAALKQRLWSGGRLLRSCQAGAAGTPGFLEDHALLGRGLIALYEATFDPTHLAWALHIAREMVRLFAHPSGGFTCAARDTEPLIAPVIDTQDRALPSGNAAAILFLLRLGALTGEGDLITRARSALRALHTRIDQNPMEHLELLAALDFALGPVKQIVLAGFPADPSVARMRRAIASRYLPNTVVVLHPDIQPGERSTVEPDVAAHLHMIRSLAPYVGSLRAVRGAATAHVCRNHTCQGAAQDPAGLERLLAS